MSVLILGIAAFCATMLGGALALRLRDQLHLILGFSAGAVVAVAFFDLLPEAFTLSGASVMPERIFTYAALGFLAYLVLDRVILLHSHDQGADHDHRREPRGLVRAASLSVHSFLDGIGIGLAFQVSPAVGAIVTAAVLAHDFSDGMNTVNVVTRDGGGNRAAFRWLLVDAAAPIAGVIVTLFFSVSEQSLGLILAVFAGFFLYIGASDLIPESQHQHPKLLTTIMTLAGAAALYGAIAIAG